VCVLTCHLLLSNYFFISSPQGLFKWPDGAMYDGEFVNGQREGHGKYTFNHGNSDKYI
jgi:hypothetical protein